MRTLDNKRDEFTFMYINLRPELVRGMWQFDSRLDTFPPFRETEASTFVLPTLSRMMCIYARPCTAYDPRIVLFASAFSMLAKCKM